MNYQTRPTSSPDSIANASKQYLLQTAISALPQGVCLYDSNNRLLLWNEKFTGIYDLDGLLSECMHLDQVISLTVRAGKYGTRTAAAILEDRHAFIARRQRARIEQIFENGTIVEIVHVPLASGGWLATYEDVTAARLMEQQLAYAANHDSLTGLANRRHFNNVATTLLEQTSDRQIGLILMDLDRFKSVNDNMGHAAGDLLLQQVARILRDTASDACLISRIGGDEFALLYSQSRELKWFTNQARTISNALSMAKISIGNNDLPISASFGVAVHDERMCLDALVYEADNALYRQKHEKRQR